MRENEQDNVLKLARNAVVLISRSWAGLIYLVSGELPHLIAALTQPIKNNVKTAILGTIQDMLAVATEGTRKTHNLLNNYLAMLLRALFQCDLYSVLAELAIEEPLAAPARVLLKTVSRVAANLMPDVPQFPIMLNSGSQTEELVADMDTAARLQKERAVINLVTQACEFV